MIMRIAVNIKQPVEHRGNDGICLNIIYMKEGKPNYFDTYAEKSRLYRNNLIHLNSVDVSLI